MALFIAMANGDCDVWVVLNKYVDTFVTYTVVQYYDSGVGIGSLLVNLAC